MAMKKNVKVMKKSVASLPKGSGAAGPKKGSTDARNSMGQHKPKGC